MLIAKTQEILLKIFILVAFRINKQGYGLDRKGTWKHGNC